MRKTERNRAPQKTRLATMLSVLTTPDKLDKVLSVIFAETTTLEVRIQRVERKKLARGIIPVKTRFGEIKVKVSKIGKQIKNIAPEYEDCKEIAIKQPIPLKNICDEARGAAKKCCLMRREPIEKAKWHSYSAFLFSDWLISSKAKSSSIREQRKPIDPFQNLI